MDYAAQGELFGEPGAEERQPAYPAWADAGVIAALHSGRGVDLSALPPYAGRLFELSLNAFSAIVHARMSEFPIAAAIHYFERAVLAAADASANDGAVTTAAERQAADRAANDRGDSRIRLVLEAAYKAGHEIHRLMGLLRFSPHEDGMYIACCEPDHFVLPAFSAHFKERFGETPWAIIDVRRRLCLRCPRGGIPTCSGIDAVSVSTELAPDGEWESLWRHYHTIINNESRNNPGLQRQFMPRRYWKYVTELQ